MAENERNQQLIEILTAFRAAESDRVSAESEAQEFLDSEQQKIQQYQGRVEAEIKALFSEAESTFRRTKSRFYDYGVTVAAEALETAAPLSDPGSKPVAQLEASTERSKQLATEIEAKLREYQGAKITNQHRRKIYARAGALLMALILVGAYLTGRFHFGDFRAIGAGAAPTAQSQTPATSAGAAPTETAAPSNLAPREASRPTTLATEASPPEGERWAWGCATGNMNVREGPQSAGRILATLFTDTCLNFDAQSENGNWLRIAPGQEIGVGWVTAKHVALQDEQALIPVITE